MVVLVLDSRHPPVERRSRVRCPRQRLESQQLVRVRVRVRVRGRGRLKVSSRARWPRLSLTLALALTLTSKCPEVNVPVLSRPTW